MEKDRLWVSWNENQKHTYDHLFTVNSENDLTEAVKQSSNIRFFGAKQSSSDIVGGVSSLIDMNSYDKILSIDKANMSITVQAGVKLVDLIETVEQNGWCIPCLPDINTVTVGGAIATGTHGTNGYLLAEYMTSCRLVLADGSIKEISESDELIDAVRVSIGSLGVMSTLTFKCEEIYTLHLKERSEKDSVWLSKISERLSTHDFQRILWMPHTNHGYVITGDKISPNKSITQNNGPSYLKHRRSVSKFLYKYTHKYPWFTAIANKIIYKLFFTSKKEHKGSLYQATVTKSRGSTIELAEWTIGLDKFPLVFEELKKYINKRDNNSFIHIPMDVRFISKDKSWLSYAYDQDTVTMGCVSRNPKNAEEYEAFISIEEIFIKHGGRPHWGKRFKAKDQQFSELYPKWGAFKELRKEMDPTGKFLNPYLKSIFNEK